MAALEKKDEKRLIRLEELTFFQEEKIAALERQVEAQRKQLDLLEQKTAEITRLLIRLKDENERLREARREDFTELPPHYQTLDWHRD